MINSDSVIALRGMAATLDSYAPVSAMLLNRLLDDLEADGEISRIIGDHPDAAEPLFPLRALAGVRWLELTGQAPELAAHLKTLTDDMTDPDYLDRAWELFQSALLAHPGEIMVALSRPVQQHQPERASTLLNALAMLGASRIRLLELGACAGLNLVFDRYRWFGKGWQWGDPDSPVRLTAAGRPPGDLEIVERRGCDLAPRDPANPADVAILRSFLPPERDFDLLNLDDAIQLAATSGVRVDKADAVTWLTERLAEDPGDDEVLTVVWHSMLWSYLPPAEQDEIERMLSGAARTRPVARVGYESHRFLTAAKLEINVYM